MPMQTLPSVTKENAAEVKAATKPRGGGGCNHLSSLLRESHAFPDCNHGMAMLGILELMASHGLASMNCLRLQNMSMPIGSHNKPWKPLFIFRPLRIWTLPERMLAW
jgi:hypothetical protein